ncbi:MAG: methyltransferase domain-containing protein [Ardenticatenaceae bacterium]|nr:methyltransferase domain-containing protein [Ardenticatenaceae bacterium]
MGQGSLHNATKTYFAQDGTVRTWWSPESPNDLLYDHFREQLRWVAEQVAWPGKQVLDLATGKGRFAIEYARHGADVQALDISGEMLRIASATAAEAGVQVRFGLGDAECLPFPDATFDVVSCMEAIMHLPDPASALREMVRVVKPNGIVLLSMTNRLRLAALARWPAETLRRLRPGGPGHPEIMWCYSIWEFRRLLADAGLEIEQIRGQGLLQATTRLPLGGGRRLPVIPRRLADWSFTHLEPPFRESPLMAVMGTIMVVCTPSA